MQRILEARYDYETCDEPLKGEGLERFERLLDEAISGTNASRYDLVEALKIHMEEYRRGRRQQERRRQHLR